MHPYLAKALLRRYLTCAIGLALLIASLGFVAGGRLEFTFMPRIESDLVSASLTLPYGSPIEQTKRLNSLVVDAAQRVIDRHSGEGKVARGLLAQVGSSGDIGFGSPRGGSVTAAAHLAQVAILLVPEAERSISAGEFTRYWREEIGELAWH